MEFLDNDKLPFVEWWLSNGPRQDTKVYVKETDTGILQHYQSYVDVKYKYFLLKTMLNPALKLSSIWHKLQFGIDANQQWNQKTKLNIGIWAFACTISSREHSANLAMRLKHFYKYFWSERVDSKGLNGRLRLRVMGSWHQ